MTMRGHRHTDATRAKMSADRKGRTLSPEHRAKISAAKKGKRRSPETRAKIGAAARGRKMPPRTPEHIANIVAGLTGGKRTAEQRQRLSGPNSVHWRGDAVPINRRIRDSAEMKAWARSVKEKDNYTCQHCGIRGGKLHSDHILPFSTHPELRFDLANGRTLCVPCHENTPTYGGRTRTTP